MVAFPTVVGVPPGAVDAAVVADHEQVYLVGVTRDSGHHGIRRNVCPVRADAEPQIPPSSVYILIPPSTIDPTIKTNYKKV